MVLYRDLFDFVIKVDAALGKKGITTVAIVVLRRQLPGIVSSFNKHSEIFSKLLEAEMAAKVIEIKAEIDDLWCMTF